MGRKPNTDVRRREIVDALLAELGRVGYERASTRSIAAAAGLAPGLVHYHFASKEEILLALVDGLIAAADARFDACVAAGATPAGTLAAFVTSRVGLGATADGRQVRGWAGVIAETITQTVVRERVAAWLARDQARLARLFRAAGAARPKQRAAILLATILGSFSLHAIDVPGAPKGHAERELLEWLAGVLASSDH